MNLLRRLLGQGCTHRFSWPRVDEFGRHYQVCLSCGTAFEYDWQLMKHTGRLPTFPRQEHQHQSISAKNSSRTL